MEVPKSSCLSLLGGGEWTPLCACRPNSLSPPPPPPPPPPKPAQGHALHSLPSTRHLCCRGRRNPGGSIQDAPKIARQTPLSFSRLSSDVQWDSLHSFTTMVAYYGILHIPLGVGGLSIVAELLHKTELDLQTKAVSLVFLQLLELAGSSWLIKSSLEQFNPSFQVLDFNLREAHGSRGWLLSSTFGLAFLLMVMGATATLAEKVLPSQGENIYNALKDLLAGNTITQCSIFFVYCLVAPCLEEIVYRGFLLRCFASHMVWPLAVVISAFIFALVHLDALGFPALFVVGCVLGCVYVWSGNLMASFLVHSGYNAAVLLQFLLH